MTLGTSIFLIAIFLGISFFVYKINQKQKWRLVGKIVGGFVVSGLLIGVGVYTYYWYINLPYEARQIGKISIGMTPVEVTLQLGKPHYDKTDNFGVRRLIYLDYDKTLEYSIKFEKDISGIERLTTACSGDYINDIFDLGVYDSEDDVIKKLGEPSSVSVRNDGLAKIISYTKWKVAFMIEQGRVIQTCVAESGEVSFAEEYKQA